MMNSNKKLTTHRTRFEKLVAKISTRFINMGLDEVDDCINNALESVGQFMKIHRSCFCLVSREDMKLDDFYEWHTKELKMTKRELADYLWPISDWYRNKIIHDEVVSLPRIKDLSDRAGRELFQTLGVQSSLSVPIIFSEKLVGFLRFDSVEVERDWVEVPIILLRMMGEIFVGALERRRTELQLRLSEKRFELFISSISDHIYVTEVTAEGDSINHYISSQAEILTGYPLENFSNDWQFWPQQVIHPDDRERASAQFQDLVAGQDREVEYRMVRADGEIIWVRDSGRVQEDGTSKIIYGVVSDITERKQAELEQERLTQELQAINQTLDERVQARTAEIQAILDAVGEGIVVTNLDGVIQYINPALEQMSGYTEAEALYQAASLWNSGRQDNEFYAQMWQTILSGQVWRGEIINRRKDGTTYDAILTITPINGLGGEPIGFVGVQSDITPFKEMDRLKDEFISTAAHELRTPLTTILGFSEILLTREIPFDTQKRYLSFIYQQAQALTAIISDLLDLSRLEAGHSFELKTKLVDLKEIVENVIFGFQENNPNHHYKLIGPEEWPQIEGDPSKLDQVLKNIFSNATKYSPDGGEIRLKVDYEVEYDLLRLALSDEGIGMSAEQLKHIFDRFYRGDTSNTAIGGTGLGMTISQLIVERHGGKIWVESERGVGTTVHIILPLPHRKSYILLIEDDAILQSMERRVLEVEGFAVLTASEGKTGLHLAQTYFPHLILLDLHLPKISGFEVLKHLKSDRTTMDIPVIITSAMNRPEDIDRAIKLGATDYQVKPYMMPDLIVRINWVLNKRSM